MLNLTRLFSSNENQQGIMCDLIFPYKYHLLFSERFRILRPLSIRCSTVLELVQFLWPAITVRTHNLIHVSTISFNFLPNYFYCQIAEGRFHDDELCLVSYAEVFAFLESEV